MAKGLFCGIAFTALLGCVRGPSPAELARAALQSARAELSQCLRDRTLQASVRFRVGLGGAAEVLHVWGVTDFQVRGCVRGAVERVRLRDARPGQEAVLRVDSGATAPAPAR
jgi:hypothetical protein